MKNEVHIFRKKKEKKKRKTAHHNILEPTSLILHSAVLYIPYVSTYIDFIQIQRYFRAQLWYIHEDAQSDVHTYLKISQISHSPLSSNLTLKKKS